eukprot:GHVN01016781.1.p1 GENE.GHVN01016781.1~~GHVN01016781.1.p1  ORF type:complete len:706 (-),score=100.65 GHVN01016781.1:905-3022(-)
MQAEIGFSSQCSNAEEKEVFMQFLSAEGKNILLDCGSDSYLRSSSVDSLLAKDEAVDLVIVSHGSLSCIGSLVHVWKKHHPQIICTIPVQRIGRDVMMERHCDLIEKYGEDRSGISAEDIDECFAEIAGLRYKEAYPFGAFVFTAYNSGHSLGGAVWRMQHRNGGLVYMSQFNHRKVGCIDGAEWEDFSSPEVLFISARDFSAPRKTKKRNETDMLKEIRQTLEGGGDVLLLCDLGMMLSELCFLLSMLETKAHVVVFSKRGRSVLEETRGMLEWMADGITREFVERKKNRFDLEKITFCDDIDEYIRRHDHRKQKIVISGDCLLDLGPARQLLEFFSQRKENKIIFTVSSRGTLGEMVVEGAETGKKINVLYFKHVELSVEEMQKAEEKENKEREQMKLENVFQKFISEEQPDRAFSELRTQFEIKNALEMKETLWTNYSADGYVSRKINAALHGFEELGVERKVIPRRQRKWAKTGYGYVFEGVAFEEEVEIAEPKKKEKARPKKYVFEERSFPVWCGVGYFDLEIFSDSRSIRAFVTGIVPKKMIVFGSDAAARESMADFFSFEAEGVASTAPGAEVQIVLAEKTKEVYLGKGLSESMALSLFDGHELAMVEGTLKQANEGAVLEAETHCRPRAFIGRPKLSELRSVFSKKNIRCTLNSGELVFDGGLRLKKPDSVTFLLEGGKNETFYRVRQVLYDFLLLL